MQPIESTGNRLRKRVSRKHSISVCTNMNGPNTRIKPTPYCGSSSTFFKRVFQAQYGVGLWVTLCVKKMRSELRNKLISVALEWQERYGIAPQITTPLSEFDAAMMVGFSETEYSHFMQDKTAVSKGSDFVFSGIRYQVKGNRPSGKPGSKITMVPRQRIMNGMFLSGLCMTKII